MKEKSISYEEKIGQYYHLTPEEAGLRRQQYETHQELIHASMGLCGESGEVMDMIKKSVNYSRPLDKSQLLEECGDVLHYLARVLDLNGLSLEDAKAHNISKLQKRFPNGYSNHAAISREDLN